MVKSSTFNKRLNNAGIMDMGANKRVDEGSLIWLQIDRVMRYGISKEWCEYYYNAVIGLWRMLSRHRQDEQEQWFRNLGLRYRAKMENVSRHPKQKNMSMMQIRDYMWDYSGELFEYCMQLIGDKGVGTENEITEIIGDVDLNQTALAKPTPSRRSEGEILPPPFTREELDKVLGL